jgi:hypothetical protein
MKAAVPSSTPAESCRGTIPLPRPLWIGLAGGAMLALALGSQFAWPVWRQHLVVAETQRLGGRVHYGDEGPELLRRWLGDERIAPFRTVDWISVDNTPADDAFLRFVGGITSLRHLDLADSAITDTGMSRLSSLTNLISLDLSGTRITNTGMQHLRSLKNLDQLAIERTGVTDAGLEHLRGMKNLGHLAIGPGVTDTGLEHLRGMTLLSDLRLSGPNITDAGLMHLKSLPALHNLWLDHTKVTGLGILELKRVNRGLWVR